MERTQKTLDEFNSRGLRRSKARESILSILGSTNSPLSVPEIELALASNYRRFNKTTVYREIEFLKAAGVVSELVLRSDRALYELSGPHHHHFVCVDCGTVRDVEAREEVWECEMRRLERRGDFRIFEHSIEFFGLCGNCQ